LNAPFTLLRLARHAVCGLALCLMGCTAAEEPAHRARDRERGRLLLEQYDCGKCHIIPGVRRAQGRVGPTLEVFARQVYIAGELPNRPELLVRWIQQPSALVPDTLMPDQGVPEAQARDMGAYLMSLL
jgi:cytochrome c